jgi:tocopherol O-methyltransferase
MLHTCYNYYMHHGYYIPEHLTAQIDLIDEVLNWSEVKAATRIVMWDPFVGCGFGGSSRHSARKFNCMVQGITLSPFQANRGKELVKVQGLEGQTSFQVSLQVWLWLMLRSHAKYWDGIFLAAMLFYD